MEDVVELSRRELLALKVIGRMGRTNDRTMALQLINDGKMIVSQDGWLQLTAKGRQILVRGAVTLGRRTVSVELLCK